MFPVELVPTPSAPTIEQAGAALTVSVPAEDVAEGVQVPLTTTS